MKGQDDFRALVRAASGLEATTAVGGSPASGFPPVPAGLERRVMMEIARRAVERSRRKARRGMVASLAGLAMLFAACIVAVVAWFPAWIPDFARISWLEKLREIPVPEFFDAAASPAAESIPFFEQWGGLLLILLLVGGAVGFVYYLNSLFSADGTTD